MSDTQIYDRKDCANYNFGSEAAPADFDPQAKGFRDAPPGVHKFIVSDYQVVPDHQFKWEGQFYTLNQLRPILRIAEGPHQDARVMDFLPLPTPGKPMPTGLANRWANFCHSMGHVIPPGRLVPDGFKLDDLLNKPLLAEVEYQIDQATKQPKFSKEGRPQVGMRFFGYSPVPVGWTPSTTPPPPKPTQQSNPNQQGSAAPAATPQAPAAIDL